MLGIHPRVIGAIANCRPERNDFPAELERLKALGNVRGFRRLLQFQPPELAEDEMFLENLRLLPEHGLTFDICLKSHELAVAEKLIPACPEVQFILDHCGNPKIGEGEWEPWAGHITRIAQEPQRRLQGLGHPRQREGRLDRRGPEAVRRARDRAPSAGTAWCGVRTIRW